MYKITFNKQFNAINVDLALMLGTGRDPQLSLPEVDGERTYYWGADELKIRSSLYLLFNVGDTATITSYKYDENNKTLIFKLHHIYKPNTIGTNDIDMTTCEIYNTLPCDFSVTVVA